MAPDRGHGLAQLGGERLGVGGAGREPGDDPQPVGVDERAEAGQQRLVHAASLRSPGAPTPGYASRMLPTGRRIGVHLPLGAGMVKAADRAVEIGAPAIQVFTDNPTAWRRRPTLPDELPAFRARLAAPTSLRSRSTPRTS